MIDVARAVRDGAFDEDPCRRGPLPGRAREALPAELALRRARVADHEPGNYAVNFMGEEEVIALRDAQGMLRVYKNWCPHRGNKVCLFDRGNRRAFPCTFHGWTFDLQGELIGLAAGKEVYAAQEKATRETRTLKEVPNVASYAGLVFANRVDLRAERGRSSGAGRGDRPGCEVRSSAARRSRDLAVRRDSRRPEARLASR
jgi:nitrite reductase/ring-hydroxylating ferredoxin subunit